MRVPVAFEGGHESADEPNFNREGSRPPRRDGGGDRGPRRGGPGGGRGGDRGGTVVAGPWPAPVNQWIVISG